MIDGLNVTESVLLNSSDLTRTIAELKNLGIKRVRMEIPGSGVSLTRVQAVVSAYRTAGIEPLMILGVHGCNGWTAARYGTWCGQVAAMFGTATYEIWNEPNLHAFWAKADAKKYVTFLRAAHTAIKAASPASTVVFGGLAATASASGLFFQLFPFVLTWYTNKDPLQFVKEAYAAGAKGFFDEMAYHSYSRVNFKPVPPTSSVVYIKRVQEIRDYMLSKGDDKRMQLTEWGFGDVTMETAAAQLPVQNALLEHDFVSHSYVYCLRDGAGGDFGVFDKNWNKKQPYYDAVKAVVNAH